MSNQQRQLKIYCEVIIEKRNRLYVFAGINFIIVPMADADAGHVTMSDNITATTRHQLRAKAGYLGGR